MESVSLWRLKCLPFIDSETGMPVVVVTRSRLCAWVAGANANSAMAMQANNLSVVILLFELLIRLKGMQQVACHYV